MYSPKIKVGRLPYLALLGASPLPAAMDLLDAVVLASCMTSCEVKKVAADLFMSR
jgi:hypothetical protein